MNKRKKGMALNIFALVMLLAILGGCGKAETAGTDVTGTERTEGEDQETGLPGTEGKTSEQEASIEEGSESRIERVDNPDGGWTETEYDEAGEMVRQACYDSDGNLKQVSEYEGRESARKLQKETYYNTSGEPEKTVTYTYNFDGSVNKITERDGAGRHIKALIYDYNEEGILKGVFEMDADYVQVRYTAYNAEGDIEYYDTDYEYDAAGNPVGQATYDADGNLQRETKFNAALQPIECKVYNYAYYKGIPKMVGYTHEKYDDAGKTIEAEYIELASEPTDAPALQKETEHFAFWCTNQDVEALEALAEALEGCYDRVTSDLGKAPSGKTEVHIAPGLKAYHNMIGRPNAPDWSAGEAYNGAIYMVSPLNPGPAHKYDDMIILAVHEYVHVVVEQFGRRQPPYLNEGIACYEAGQNGNCEYYVRNDTGNGTLPALTDFTDLESFSKKKDSGKAYAYAYLYINFIVDTSGFDTVIFLLEGKSQTEAFGMSMEELNEKWMDYMASYVQ